MTFSASVHAAAVYKWIDANGKAQYSDKPHPSAKPLSLPKNDTPSQTDDARDAERQRLLDVFAEEREERKAQDLSNKIQREERERACAKAKRRVHEYRHAGYLYDKETDGYRRVFNDDEHAKALRDADMAVEQWCD
jgi:hypothetical protein